MTRELSGREGMYLACSQFLQGWFLLQAFAPSD